MYICGNETIGYTVLTSVCFKLLTLILWNGRDVMLCGKVFCNSVVQQKDYSIYNVTKGCVGLFILWLIQGLQMATGMLINVLFAC